MSKYNLVLKRNFILCNVVLDWEHFVAASDEQRGRGCCKSHR